MIKVQSHGREEEVQNPSTKEWQRGRVVTFIEEGREGLNAVMMRTSNFLDKVTGTKSGLIQTRTHTQFLTLAQLEHFPVGKVIPGHINRRMDSLPQMRQQQTVSARLVDGKPTYVSTWLDEVPLPDDDQRMENALLIQLNPSLFLTARAGAAEVRIIEEQMAFAEGPQGNLGLEQV